jgi:hypothetical protein
LIRATASSKFQLRETLRRLTKPTPTGDPDAYRRELRFRKSWLYALHLATPHKPTCLGTAYSAFRYMPSDVKEITMATPALPIEETLQKLGQ